MLLLDEQQFIYEYTLDNNSTSTTSGFSIIAKQHEKKENERKGKIWLIVVSEFEIFRIQFLNPNITIFPSRCNDISLGMKCKSVYRTEVALESCKLLLKCNTILKRLNRKKKKNTITLAM